MKKYLFALLTLMLMLTVPVAMAEAVYAAPPVTIDITQIVIAVLGVLSALITYRLIPWIKANTTESQQAILESTARIAVFAAEQLYGALNGSKKLAYVQAYMIKKGYDVNTQEVKNTIEAMVQELTLVQPEA
jgi:xanthosine utilization system XapX-like protein